MNTLDPLIEGYLSYLLEVGRKAPRTVIDALILIHMSGAVRSALPIRRAGARGVRRVLQLACGATSGFNLRRTVATGDSSMRGKLRLPA